MPELPSEKPEEEDEDVLESDYSDYYEETPAPPPDLAPTPGSRDRGPTYEPAIRTRRPSGSRYMSQRITLETNHIIGVLGSILSYLLFKILLQRKIGERVLHCVTLGSRESGAR